MGVLLLVLLAGCKPQTASAPASQSPTPSELIRLAVWPDEDTRWRVCEDTWEEFAKGGHVREDVTAAALRYTLPVPLEGVRGELRLFWPLASVVQECGDLALRGLRPYRPSNRPPVMVHQPFLAYWGPEKPPKDWQAQLVLLDGRGNRVGYLPSSPSGEGTACWTRAPARSPSGWRTPPRTLPRSSPLWRGAFSWRPWTGRTGRECASRCTGAI